MNEIWKSIKGYEGLYEISNLGNVRSQERIVPRGNHYIRIEERILKPGKDKDGYLQVMLSKNGIQKIKKVHRLVAEYFIENNNSLPMVNHKNEIKDDNRVENLEWCDVVYNNNYGTARERSNFTQSVKYGKSVIKKDLNGNVLNKYPSLRYAGRKNNTTATQIRRVCQGKQRTCMGYVWEFSE